MTSRYFHAGGISALNSVKENSMSSWFDEASSAPAAASQAGFRSLSRILFADLKHASPRNITVAASSGENQGFGKAMIAPENACYEKGLEAKGSPFAIVNYILSEGSASSRWLRATGFMDQRFDNGLLDVRFHPDGTVVAVLTALDGRKRTVVCREDGCYFQRLTNPAGEELVRFSSQNPKPTSSNMLARRPAAAQNPDPAA